MLELRLNCISYNNMQYVLGQQFHENETSSIPSSRLERLTSSLLVTRSTN